MTKFYGAVGYGYNKKVRPGVVEDVIEERKYYGDVLRISRKLQETGEKLNSDISIGNSFSIMADAFAYNNFMNMKYILWQGVAWKITDVEVATPRLILRVGDLYLGERASP